MMSDQEVHIPYEKFETAIVPLLATPLEVKVSYDIKHYHVDYDTNFGWEICIPIEGSYQLETLIRASASHKLTACLGEALLICPQSQTRTQALPVKSLHLVLQFSRLSITLRDHSNTVRYDAECHEASPAHQKITQNLFEIAHLLKKQSTIHRQKADLLFRLTLIEMLENSRTDQQDGSPPSKIRSTFTRFYDFVLRYYYKPLDSAQFAEAFGMSPQHLSKLAQKMRGMSLNELISLTRLEKARKKLNKFSINELAKQCGFSNPSYFIQLFKKTYGFTPLQLAKRLDAPSKDQDAIELNRTEGFTLLQPTNRKPSLNPVTYKDYHTVIFANHSDERINLIWLPNDQPAVVVRTVPPRDRIHIGSSKGDVWSIQSNKKTSYYKVPNCHALIVVE